MTGIWNCTPPKLKSEELTLVPTYLVNLKRKTSKSISSIKLLTAMANIQIPLSPPHRNRKKKNSKYSGLLAKEFKLVIKCNF
jgi:hypothetical protein